MSTICTRCDESASTCVCVEPRLLEVGKANTYASLPFFTPSPDPIPPAAYHNVFPPVTPEGIQEAAKRLRRLSLRLKNAPIDYTHEPMPLDMGIRDESHGPACGCDDEHSPKTSRDPHTKTLLILKG